MPKPRARRSPPARRCWSPAPPPSAAGPALMPTTSRRSGATDERRRLGRRARGRQQARARLAAVAAQAVAAAAEARRRAARPRPRRPPARRGAARRPLHRRQRDLAAQGSRFRRGRSRRRRLPSSSRASPGFATSPPRRRARRARGSPKPSSAAGCSPTAPGSTRPGRRICGASASSSGPLTRPTSCRAATPATARRLLNTLARGARHLEANADKAAAGLDRVTAWCGVVAAGLLVQGGVPRVARGRSGPRPRARRRRSSTMAASSAARRSSRCSWSTASACCAPAISPPSRRFPTASRPPPQASLAALHGVTMGDGALSSWQGCDPGEPSRLDGADRRLRAARAAASPGARLGLSADVGARHDRSSSTPRRRRRRRSPSTARPRRSRSNCPTAAQRLVVNCGGPGPLPTDLPDELVAGPAHDGRPQHAGPRRHQFDQHPRRWLARQRRRGRHHRPQRGQ